MTQPPHERRWLLEELARRGIRLTVQRRALVEIMQEAGAHLDAPALLDLAKARAPGIDRATVYRTLELLKRLGLIDELHRMPESGEGRYHETRTKRDHIHLRCAQCGRIEEFGSPLFDRLKKEITRAAGFEIQLARLEARGRCRLCRHLED